MYSPSQSLSLSPCVWHGTLVHSFFFLLPTPWCVYIYILPTSLTLSYALWELVAGTIGRFFLKELVLGRDWVGLFSLFFSNGKKACGGIVVSCGDNMFAYILVIHLSFLHLYMLLSFLFFWFSPCDWLAVCKAV